MIDVAFWLQYGLLIFFGGLFAIMILVSIILAEWNEFKKRRKEKSK